MANRASEFRIGMIRFPNPKEFMDWIDEYPRFSANLKDLNDLSIVKEWERMYDVVSSGRVRIWSYDSDLAGYDRIPPGD